MMRNVGADVSARFSFSSVGDIAQVGASDRWVYEITWINADASDSDLAALISAFSPSHVKTLHLPGCDGIGEKTVEEIVRLVRENRVESLSLADNRMMESKGLLSIIAASMANQSLKVLSVKGCWQIRENEIRNAVLELYRSRSPGLSIISSMSFPDPTWLERIEPVGGASSEKSK